MPRNNSECHRSRIIHCAILFYGDSARRFVSLYADAAWISKSHLRYLVCFNFGRAIPVADYLFEKQRISVGVAVEVSIVSVLREVIIRGALEISWQQILAVCGFLLVLGGLLLIRAWMARIFNRIEMEKRRVVPDDQFLKEDRLPFDDIVR